jgi:hypothetical protein
MPATGANTPISTSKSPSRGYWSTFFQSDSHPHALSRLFVDAQKCLTVFWLLRRLCVPQTSWLFLQLAGRLTRTRNIYRDLDTQTRHSDSASRRRVCLRLATSVSWNRQNDALLGVRGNSSTEAAFAPPLHTASPHHSAPSIPQLTPIYSTPIAWGGSLTHALFPLRTVRKAWPRWLRNLSLRVFAGDFKLKSDRIDALVRRT